MLSFKRKDTLGLSYYRKVQACFFGYLRASGLQRSVPSVTMGRTPKKVSYFPRKKVDREYFPLPKADETLCRRTLFAVEKRRIAYEFGKVYGPKLKKKRVILNTFMAWEVFRPWALLRLLPKFQRMVQQWPGDKQQHRMSFIIDTDEGTNDYQSVWLAMFPALWIEKKGVDGTLLEEWRPISNVSCIYNCKEESLRVSFNYEVIHYAPTKVTKKKHAPLANASPKKASPPKSPIQCRKMPSQPKKAKDLM